MIFIPASDSSSLPLFSPMSSLSLPITLSQFFISKYLKRKNHRPSPSAISCCSTIEYTLAFSNVKTVAVFLSNPLNASRISTEGFAERSAKIAESCCGFCQRIQRP
jgi:hypothetical protein